MNLSEISIFWLRPIIYPVLPTKERISFSSNIFLKEAAEAPSFKYFLSPPIPASPIWFEVYHPSEGSNLLLVLSTLWLNDTIERILSPASDFTEVDASEYAIIFLLSNR